MVKIPDLYVRKAKSDYEWQVVAVQGERVLATLDSEKEAEAFMDGYQEGVVDAKTGHV
jgi:hypothetical protein